MQNFRDGSHFRRLVAMRPGEYLPLVPRSPEVLIPRLPAGFTDREVLAPRKYLGRLETRQENALDCTLWEVPNGRELIATLDIGDPDIQSEGDLHPGTRIELWTWREPSTEGPPRERVHVRPRPASVAPTAVDNAEAL